MCEGAQRCHCSFLMPIRRGASSASLGNHSDVASTAAETLSAEDAAVQQLAQMLKKRKTAGNSDSIEATRFNLETGNFIQIFQAFQGKLDAQALCLQFIKDGKFEDSKRRRTDDPGQPRAAVSTNKLHMLSIENWAEILHRVDPAKFDREVCALASKSWLTMTGCFVGGIIKESALPSRYLHAIAQVIKFRSVEIYGSRHEQIVIRSDDAGESLVVQHCFNRDPGCFFAEYTQPEYKSGFIVHNGSAKPKQKVPIPAEFLGSKLRFKHNHSDD